MPGSSSGHPDARGSLQSPPPFAARGCFECGDLGHIKRFCPHLTGGSSQQRSQLSASALVTSPLAQLAWGGGIVPDDNAEEDDITGMIHDAYGYANTPDANNLPHHNEEPNLQAQKFYKLLEDAETEIYPGCKNVSKLSFVVRLLHLKCLNHWTNKSMDDLLSFFKEVLPVESFVPNSFYEAKKVLRDLGLGYTKIDACQNDCILYWREHANAQSCPKCGESRWKSKENGGKKVAHKVLRHFPTKPRLQRLYMARETAKKMRRHKEEHVDDGILRHPSDAMAWKSFDEKHPSFSAELRNVRLGLASDGFQPYGNMSSNRSIWPVVLVPYNLPPWDCMKSEYFMMTILIPGPKCPGNDIDVYLQPMIKELKELWEGVENYDAHSKSNFMMRAAIMWTINDFPEYGNLSGLSTKGKFACPCCHKDTQSISLRSKLCYMGHRCFLPLDHPWRKNKRLFDGKVEKGVAPNPLIGDDVLMQLQGLGNVTFGKGQKRKRNAPNNAYNWKKKNLDILEAEITITLCKFQMVFPPAFFDVMVHLPIHLAREAKLGGPVQYRWMYPFERYLRILKSYVCNYARPEGSIAEGYLAEESLTFCSRYLKEYLNQVQ
ncbi:PREDICTED: uncharacterized protein LOC109217034 [Nicotiana attenuata]|uniref:uncharacterized protein LOC109217034 n=1 Tax=Nicotiana attenuata TaxID=49451 RepID=UPI0009052FFC|nr:PREDICTED: uncharacterized protein LOC109217034 [Nicotiana attenuata]